MPSVPATTPPQPLSEHVSGDVLEIRKPAAGDGPFLRFYQTLNMTFFEGAMSSECPGSITGKTINACSNLH
jgi:hypothetical protein